MAMCEECGQRPATIRLGLVVNGEKQEKQLCAVCMSQMHKKIPGLNLGDLAGVLSGLMDAKKANVHGHERPKADEMYMSLSCPECGMEYGDFQKTGLVGCSGCYRAFRMPIEELLTRVSGQKRHLGRVPGGSSAELSNKLAADKLRQRLSQAIAAEEYEEAAILRDKIRALESQSERATEEAGANG